MTADEHPAQHQRLHAALDALLACFIETETAAARRRGIPWRSLQRTSVLDLVDWSHRMCTEAEAVPEPAAGHTP